MAQILKQLGYALSRKQTGVRHLPSELAGSMTTCADGIEAYINRTSAIIRTIRTGLDANTDESVIQGNTPFFMSGNTSSESSRRESSRSRVVLMVHGLTDSPYVTRDLASTFSKQGFDVLSILLPGHGTCPGDLLKVTWQDWLHAQADALDLLDNSYDDVYLCGFSLGAALNLYQAVTDKRIKGLFLFSPALQLTPAARITCALSRLTPWLPHLKWIDVQPDDDPFKYESISANAICQTRGLVSRLRNLLHLEMPDIPVFIAASDDDATVQTSAVISFFEQLKNEHKRLLFFSRHKQQLSAEAQVIFSELPEQKVISSSHMAMIVAPDNPHYGRQGDYAFCNHYYWTDPDKYARCKAFQEDCLGEIFGETDPGQVIRRLTYNPWYGELEQELSQFIEKFDN